MTASDRAERIAKLADALGPLGRKARGMALPADEWNQLVAAMLAIDRDQDEEVGARLEQGFARADHEHLGQVSLAWLDAELQALVGGQEPGSVATRQQIAVMQRALEVMQAEVTRLAEAVNRQQGQADDARVDALDWTRRLNGFDDRFSGLEDLSVSVSAAVKEQAALKRNVGRVLKLERTLTDAAGAPLDVAGMADRVKELEALRGSLTGVDEKPLRLRDLQLEILKLREALPRDGGGGLDGRLAAFETDLRERLAAESADRFDDVREELDTRDTGLRDLLDERFGAGLSASRSAAQEAAREAVAGAEGRFDDKLGSARSELEERLRGEVSAATTRALGDLAPTLAGMVETRVGSLRDQIQADVRTRLDAGLAEALRGVEERLGGRVEGLRGEFGTLEGGLDARIDAGAARAGAEADARAAARVRAEVEALGTALRASLDEQVRAGVDTQMAGVRELAVRAVADGLGDVQGRIDATVAGATRDIDGRVAAVVAEQVGRANIDGRITAATDQLASRLRSEIQSSVATLQSSTTRQLDAAVVNLRSEFTRGGTGPVIGRDITDTRTRGR